MNAMISRTRAFSSHFGIPAQSMSRVGAASGCGSVSLRTRVRLLAGRQGEVFETSDELRFIEATPSAIGVYRASEKPHAERFGGAGGESLSDRELSVVFACFARRRVGLRRRRRSHYSRLIRS